MEKKNNLKLKKMGQRLIQKIYQCSLCNNIPEDGERLWQMNNETWCEKCCEQQDEIANEDGETKQ